MLAMVPDGAEPPKVVCGFSTDAAIHKCLSNMSLVMRKPGWRAQM